MDVGRMYREGAVQGASPIALVARLYEHMVEHLRQTAIAIERNDIEGRTKRINHMIVILGHLQSSLDFASGGRVATDLANFYGDLRSRLWQLQCSPSQTGVEQVITDLLAVREAWVEVERSENRTHSLTTGSVSDTKSLASEDGRGRL
jgi:flagellar biosynthetic protein FliS